MLWKIQHGTTLLKNEACWRSLHSVPATLLPLTLQKKNNLWAMLLYPALPGPLARTRCPVRRFQYGLMIINTPTWRHMRGLSQGDLAWPPPSSAGRLGAKADLHFDSCPGEGQRNPLNQRTLEFWAASGSLMQDTSLNTTSSRTTGHSEDQSLLSLWVLSS